MTTTDSASGSAKAARDSRFQAIMPIRGKILNLEKATREAMLNNEEVKTLILAFGCGFEETFDITKLRFGKIILLPDADSDKFDLSSIAKDTQVCYRLLEWN